MPDVPHYPYTVKYLNDIIGHCPTQEAADELLETHKRNTRGLVSTILAFHDPVDVTDSAWSIDVDER